jgi:hypothetical protein
MLGRSVQEGLAPTNCSGLDTDVTHLYRPELPLPSLREACVPFLLRFRAPGSDSNHFPAS